MAGVTGSIPVAPTIAAPQSLVQFLLPLFTRIRARCVLRAADPCRRRRLQPRRDAAAGRRGRQGPDRDHGVSRSSGCRPTRSTICCCRTRCSTQVERSIAEVVAASSKLFPDPDRRRAAAAWRAGSTTPRSSSIAARSWAWCPRPTCRTTANSTRSAISSRAPTCVEQRRSRLAGQDGAVRHRPAVPLDRHGAASPSMSRSARTSGCRCRRRATPALRRRRGAAQPVGQQHHHRQGRDAPPAVRQPVGARHRGLRLFRRRARRVDDRPRLGRPCRRSSRCGDQLAETERFEQELDDRAVADVDLGRIRQERMRNNSFADCALRERAAGRAVSARSPSPSMRRAAASALDRAVERFPYVPSDPAKLRDNCYEAYNIQVQGLAQRLQSSRRREAVIGVSGGLDSTQALIVSAGRWTGSACRATTSWPTRCRASPPRDETTGQRLAADEGARRRRRPRSTSSPAADQMLADIGHPFGQGREGLRRDLRERAGRAAHRLPVPPRQPATAAWWSAPAISPSWGSAGAPTASAITCRTTIPTPRSPRR